KTCVCVRECKVMVSSDSTWWVCVCVCERERQRESVCVVMVCPGVWWCVSVCVCVSDFRKAFLWVDIFPQIEFPKGYLHCIFSLTSMSGKSRTWNNGPYEAFCREVAFGVGGGGVWGGVGVWGVGVPVSCVC